MRVSDTDPEMLSYLSERGISPGDRFEVRDRQPFGGPLFVSFDGREHPIGGQLGARDARRARRRPRGGGGMSAPVSIVRAAASTTRR